MAKKKNRGNKKETAQPLQNTTVPLAQEIALETSQIMEEVLQVCEKEDLEGEVAIPHPETSDPSKLLSDLKELWAICQRLKNHHEALCSSLENRESSLSEREATFKQNENQLKIDKTELNNQKKLFSENKNELNDRLQSILAREADAESGFSELSRKVLEKLQFERDELLKQVAKLRQKITEEIDASLCNNSKSVEEYREKTRKIWDEESDKAARELEQVREKLEEERLQFENDKKKLAKQESKIKSDQEKLEWDLEDLANSKKMIDQRVKELSVAEKAKAEIEIKNLHSKLEAAQADRESHFKRAEDLENIHGMLRGRSMNDILKENKKLNDELEKLKEELQRRPGEDLRVRLAETDRKLSERESHISRLNQSMNELKIKDASQFLSVTEMETLNMRKKALEAQNSMLVSAVDELHSQYDSLMKSSEQKIVFPSLTAYDNNSNLQTPVGGGEAKGDLKSFIESLQHQIATPNEEGRRLYFSLADLRCFVAGLAMSKLHLLQGISGTGKTSLPIAFANAVCCQYSLVEVQAGWRDKQDLIGHYNAFEKRFVETEFLHALYKAQCPANYNRPYLIVLDEMNLSHPEQYFADILSALEQGRDNQIIKLMTASVSPAPKYLSDGRSIKLPPNVWFVGTANHDETTKDFADKTYDRAHVIELPTNRLEFEVRKQPQQRLNMDYLAEQFREAKKRYQDSHLKAYGFIEKNFRNILQENFRIGWGNRLCEQMNRFIPVVCHAGGTVGEGTDHILFSKLFRKFRDRHDNQPESLRELLKILKEKWASLDSSCQPIKSIDLIKHELLKLGACENGE